MAVAALLVVVFDLELVFGAVPPLLSFLLIVLHVEYSATIPFTSWPAFLLCPKEKPHGVSFLPIFLWLDSEVNQMSSGILSMPLPTLLSKNSIKYQINIESRDPLLTKSKTVKTNTQYYTIRWRKKLITPQNWPRHNWPTHNWLAKTGPTQNWPNPKLAQPKLAQTQNWPNPKTGLTPKLARPKTGPIPKLAQPQNWPNPKTGPIQCWSDPETGLIQKLVQFQIWFNPKSRFYENKNLYIFKMRTFSNGLSPYRSSSDECWSLECQGLAKPEQRQLGVWGP